MAKKEVIYQGLSDLNVLIDDTTANSPDYFRITNLPGEFTAGINIFKFKGNPALFPEGSPVFIEVLDANGLPVYYEIGLDLESQEQSAIISVYINEDTVPGNGSITICGQANQSSTGQILDASEINVRWSVPVYIDISKRNVDEIIFDELPVVTITATTGSYTNLGYPSNTRTESATWSNVSYIYRNGEATLYTSSLSFPAFPSTATNTTVTLYYGDIADVNQRTNEEIYTTAEFTSSISTYSGSGIAYLTDPIIFPVNNSSEQHIVQSGVINTMDVVYEQSASLASQSTENTHNIAVVQFSGLQPQVGEISKIRSYYKSAGVQEYIFSNETDISDLADEFGFTANIVTASFALPTIHRNDRFDFKFEFVNPSGYVSKQVLEYRDVLFLGGNTYIGGEDNLITGSLYVAGATGTGVHISGKGNAAMMRSIGYEGFAKALAGTGAGGFVIYSGSVQPLLNASEQYVGVGIELFANTASYFKYTTSGSGLLDIRTDQFFLGGQNQFISGSNGNIIISSSNFSINQAGNTAMSGDIIANTGIFKDVNIIGTIAKKPYEAGVVPATASVLEPWITSSALIATANQSFNIAKLPLTFSNAGLDPFGNTLKAFKFGAFYWTGSCINYDYDFETNISTPLSSINFASASAAITGSSYDTFRSGSNPEGIFDYSAVGSTSLAEYSGLPLTFANWGDLSGYEGGEYGFDVNGNMVTASIDTVIFNVITGSVPYTLSILSEEITVDDIFWFNAGTNPNAIQLQLQAKFINNTPNWMYSYYGVNDTQGTKMYDCKFTVDIYNGSDVLLLSDSRIQESENEWIDFNIPLTALLLKTKTSKPLGQGGTPFYFSNKFKIKLSWQAVKHTLPTGHGQGTAPKQIRLTELRIVKVPTAVGLRASAINFSDSYLASAPNGTVVQGNLIPVDDQLYDLGSSNQNPLLGDNGTNTVTGVAQKRWNNIYGKFLSADNAIAIGNSVILQPSGSIVSGENNLAAGKYSHAEGTFTSTGQKIYVTGDTSISGDFYIANYFPPLLPGEYYDYDYTTTFSTVPGPPPLKSLILNTDNIQTVGYDASNVFIGLINYTATRDIVRCTSQQIVTVNIPPGGAITTAWVPKYTLQYLDLDGNLQPYTGDVRAFIQVNDTYGKFAHAEGTNTNAVGFASHTEGSGVQALGYASHAEGLYTQASGSYSHAEGGNTKATGIASHAEGNYTKAIGSYSHAEGNSTTAYSGHAEGQYTLSVGGYSHAEGSYTRAGTDDGYLAKATGSGEINLLAIYGNITTKFPVGLEILVDDYAYEGSISTEINKPIAKVVSSSWTGTQTRIVTNPNLYNIFQTDPLDTHIIPLDTNVFYHESGSSQYGGYSAHAEGFKTQTLGGWSHAEGTGSMTTGVYSHAEGNLTLAIGNSSHTEGAQTKAYGFASHAEGFYTVTSGSYQHVQGQYNISSSAQSAFIIGNGTADGSRSNLVFASGSQVQITGSLLVTGSAGITGTLTADTSISAPIFYDSNNTAYSVNPEGTSNLFTLNALSSISAPIYYNVGSTSYYVNPGSNSRLNSLETTNRIGINQSSPSYPLHVNANVSGTSIYASADIVAYSDESVKGNIRLIENVIERIQQSRGVLYDRIDIDSKNNIGFIAQELEVAFPELIVTNEDGTKAVKYQNTVAVLFEAIKDQQKQIDELKQIVDGINR